MASRRTLGQVDSLFVTGSQVKRIQILLKLSVTVAGMLVIAFGLIYFVRAFDARSLPDLEPEHWMEFESEFGVEDENETDWEAYLDVENGLYAEIKRRIHDQERSGSILDRYSSTSQMFPDSFDRNWNRSFEFPAESPRGVAILLHGLTDSPYSMRATAGLLVNYGYSVIAPRMPGHGFAVGGLRQARWEDWAAAVRIAVRHALNIPGGEQSLLLVGYSNGGLLALEYALTCDRENVLPCPDRMILMSPAISVSPATAIANWHSAVSWHPYFEKFAWLNVRPEVDPFKFTSFPKRPGWEIYRLASRVHGLMNDTLRTEKLPSILTFQSAVDNTVSAIAIVDILYSRLPPGISKLVVYDVNRTDTAVHLMNQPHRNPLAFFRARAPLDFTVSVLRNRSHDSAAIDAYSLLPGDDQYQVAATALAWPPETYSLSHIALPFTTDDPLYGHAVTSESEAPRIVLGSLKPRGEAGVLQLSSDYFLRMRSNPFFSYQATTIQEWLLED